ncbi:MAG: glycosyltransferase [Bacteroidales bacterium]|jgi:GT2 family glycosyltransferase|nr:glycosyltransferase [Bacteroidales bacterium]
MKGLSIIIVNYNVKHFLEQCLHSVKQAVKQIDAEIFVVDNNSVDGSCAMMREKFPEIQLIANKENLGFSKANNQAMRIATGKYILLLNPDTIVEEDTFSKILPFMDENPDVGGLGVKMIDGKGQFLPESKRGLPTPKVAFYKIFGLSSIFRKSKRFGQYHLSYLDKDEIHEVDVLSGAFMFMRKTCLDKVGLLDEQFFMYGEDIDLSYRITKGGYKNIYFPKTRIIHYKGESTKKGSINYVRIFYQAMIIFANKHFTQKNAKLYANIINFAIYIRAAIAIITRFFNRALLPAIDAVLIWLGFFLITPLWEIYKFGNQNYYPDSFIKYAVPAYALVWLITLYMSGGYDKPTRLWKLLRGIMLGSMVILVFYSLLPENYRYSRALILLGSTFVFLTLPLVRIIGSKLKFTNIEIYNNRKKRIVLVGSKQEISRIESLIDQSGVINPEIVGYVADNGKTENGFFLGELSQMDEIIKVHKIDEIVFCAKDISSQKIISTMLNLSELKTNYKIATPDGISVIGSNSINTAGDLYTLQINTIVTAQNKRKKRIVDVAVSLFILLFFPIFIILTKSVWGIFRNALLVLFGFKSWVGYADSENSDDHRIPSIKPGIVSTATPYRKKSLTNDKIARLNLVYAKDYRMSYDLSIILKSIPCLGQRKK